MGNTHGNCQCSIHREHQFINESLKIPLSKNIKLDKLHLQENYCLNCKHNYMNFVGNQLISYIQTPFLGTCIRIKMSNELPYSLELGIKIDLSSHKSRHVQDFIDKIRHIDSQLMSHNYQKSQKRSSLKEILDSEYPLKKNSKSIFPGDIVMVKRRYGLHKCIVRFVQTDNRVWVSRKSDGRVYLVKLSKIKKETLTIISKICELSFSFRKLIGEKIISYLDKKLRNCIPSEEFMKEKFYQTCQKIPIMSLINKKLPKTWRDYFHNYISSYYSFNCQPFILWINIDLRQKIPEVYTKIGKNIQEIRNSDMYSFLNSILGKKCKLLIEHRISREGMSLWGKQIQV